MNMKTLNTMKTKLMLGLMLAGGLLNAGATLFGSGLLDAVIPDNNPNGYVSGINVSGLGSQLQTLTVNLDISGGYNGDLYGYLYYNGVKIDRELHKEVLERYSKLNIAPYGGFMNPVYTPVMEGGDIKDITVSYPDDYVQQMLEYSKNFSFLPAWN